MFGNSRSMWAMRLITQRSWVFNIEKTNPCSIIKWRLIRIYRIRLIIRKWDKVMKMRLESPKASFPKSTITTLTICKTISICNSQWLTRTSVIQLLQLIIRPSLWEVLVARPIWSRTWPRHLIGRTRQVLSAIRKWLVSIQVRHFIRLTTYLKVWLRRKASLKLRFKRLLGVRSLIVIRVWGHLAQPEKEA